MKALTNLEIEKAAMLKSYRASIRLKHAIAADREIAETLPQIERKIDDALQSGTALELNPGQAFDDNFGA